MIPSKLSRIPNEYYITPIEVVNVLSDIVKIKGIVFEPFAGNGSISSCFENCITNDLYTADNYNWDYKLDLTLAENWLFLPQFDWVVTNPPFNSANYVLSNSWNHVQKGVAVLLRLSFMEPCKYRSKWLKENSDSMSHLIIINPRPKFRDDTKSTDSVTVAWMVWQKHFSWKQLGMHCPFNFINW